MILGLNGLKGSGKDTVAAYLIKEHGFERRAFADPLKKSIAALFDIPYHEIDKMKNDPNVVVKVGIPSSPEFDELVNSKHTFRQFLQRYGTESHRDVFGENFWADQTLPKDAFYRGRNIAITDCRFANEAMRVHSCGGFVVEIIRPGLDDADQHSSEASLDPRSVDYKLENVSTLVDLYERTERMLTMLGEERMAAWSNTKQR